MRIDGRNARLSAISLPLLSLPGVAPVRLRGRGCRLYLNGGFVALLSAIPVRADGTWSLENLPIPSDPSLTGFPIAFQAALTGGGAPAGYELTNAVFATLGL